MSKMKAQSFAQKAIDITKFKTLYVKGGFGLVLNPRGKARAITSYDYNAQRAYMINSVSNDTFAFDCCGLAKGILWGFSANLNLLYGGANYASNGVPDLSEAGFARVCPNLYRDFSDIQVGACVFMTGHMGIYVGNGLVAESTPIWKNGAQLTALGNIGTVKGYPTRKWTTWGLIPYVDYTKEEPPKEDDEMLTYEQWVAYYERYQKEQRNAAADDYAKNALEWAKKEGILIGDTTGNQMPQSPIKREDLACVLYSQEMNKEK